MRRSTCFPDSCLLKYDETGDWRNAWPQMNWELPRLAGKYPRSVAQMIHRRAIPIWQTSQRDVKELRIQLFADIQGAAATDDYKGDDAMFLLSDLDKGVDNAPLEELEKLAAELEANKKLDEWARKIAVAIVYNHIAWNHRGTGWAHTVKPEAWKKHGNCGRISRKPLTPCCGSSVQTQIPRYWGHGFGELSRRNSIIRGHTPRF